MSRTFVCNANDIPDNGMKGFEVGDKRVLIAKSGHRFYAYQGLCPHQNALLDEGMLDGTVLTCHQHMWQWNIETGDPVGLGEAPLHRYGVEVDSTAIYVIEISGL